MRIPALIVLGVAVAATPGSANEADLGKPAMATFEGRWIIRDGIAAAHGGATAEPLAAWLGQAVVFAPTRVDAPPPLGCSEVRYDTAQLPAEGLFQGTLTAAPDPAHRARELRLDPVATPTLQVSCDSGVFDYHLDGDGRLRVMLDNVIYLLERPRSPDQPPDGRSDPRGD